MKLSIKINIKRPNNSREVTRSRINTNNIKSKLRINPKIILRDNILMMLN